MKIHLDDETYEIFRRYADARNVPIGGLIATMCRNMARQLQERELEREMKKSSSVLCK
ncbi:TPA: hypothetical protein QA377_003252 [Raoultella ornithinolytica]|nr:hypothetical protein [Raoultella ornithinolytica]